MYISLSCCLLISIGLSLQYFALQHLLVNATKVLQVICELDQGLINQYEDQCEKFIQNFFVPFNQTILYYKEMEFNKFLNEDIFTQVEKNTNNLQIDEEDEIKSFEEQEEKVRKKKLHSKNVKADIIKKRNMQVTKDM